jgi:hypothetical protein
VSQFCRHNRFIAECPICSKGTVLDPAVRAARRPASGASGSATRKRAAVAAPAPAVKGPYGSAGPYDSEGGRYEVRLERVPGGLRLGAWAAGSLQRRAPELDAADLGSLIASAVESGAIADGDGLLEAANAAPAGVGRSPGRAGELRDELRVEPLDAGRLRIARWVMRPGRGWELQDAPVMLPALRFAQALRGAAAPAS